jgi:hypothetical protein
VIFRSERGFGHKTRFWDSADYHYEGSASTLEMALLISDPQRERVWLQPKTPAPTEVATDTSLSIIDVRL